VIHLLVLILVIWFGLQLFGQLGVGMSQPVLIVVLLLILFTYGGYGWHSGFRW